jgi:protein-tyrosine-phosphatase
LKKALQAAWGRLQTYYALARARRDTDAALARPVHRVLVVCYGNIYRSAFLGAYLRQRSQGVFEVRSSGLYTKVGRASPERHIAMSRERGVDLSQHRSSVVTANDIAWADIVIAMDRHNWHALRQLQTPMEKVIWAGALTSGDVEVRDPYEMTDDAAKQTIGRLCDAGDALLARLGVQR